MEARKKLKLTLPSSQDQGIFREKLGVTNPKLWLILLTRTHLFGRRTLDIARIASFEQAFRPVPQ